MGQIRPLAVPLYEWAKQHGQELPPFPSADYLQTPYLPTAPCLPDDPKAQLRMAAVTWSTGIRSLIGAQPTANPKVHDANKLCIAQLAALGIPPAEWLLSRIEVHEMSDLHNKLDYPPFGFVYSSTALSAVLDADYRMDRWIGSLSVPRRYVSIPAQEAQTLWYKIRQAYVRGEDTAVLLEQYRLTVARCREHHASVKANLQSKVSVGEYVW